MTEQTYHFVLLCELPDEVALHTLEDALFEAGCDDALLHVHGPTLSIEFDRQSTSCREAISSALHDVYSTELDLVLRRLGPDDLVSSAEIARRAGVSREAVRLWHASARRQDFPRALTHVGKSEVWSWQEVVTWLHAQELLDAKEVEQAELIAALNHVITQQRSTRHTSWAHDLLGKTPMCA